MSVLFTAIFLFAIVAYVGLSYYLHMRQIRAINKSFGQVPKQFSKKISLQQHQKAGNYTKAKLGFSLKQTIFGIAILLLWTLGGGLDLLDKFLVQFGLGPIWLGVVFMLSFIFINYLIEIPLSFYKTFVLEEKFGFNNSTKKIFLSDMVKGLLLGVLIALPLVYLILYLMNVSGGWWWFFVWLVLVGVSMLMMWVYPNYIAPLFNKFKALDNKGLTTKITNLLAKTGFSSNGIFVMDGSKRSSHGNAYFTGLGKQKRIVFFDTLLKGLSDNEILAVLGHELGHFAHKHIKKQMIGAFIIMLVALAILGYLIDQHWFYQGLGVDTYTNYLALILFLLISPVFSFFIQPLQNSLSRKHEYQADAFAAKHTNADDLILALVGLYRDNASTLTPDSYYSLFYDTHPSASLRISHLKKEE